ncbi:zinc-ribbon domain-containing protein [Frigoribacterium sp. 9N]|uniref:zinc-ribbon domain-containing protein n=1 Tax=Frigoribacterium sp. 9N TaxID=2653144 RepID=UPI0012F312B0|nr:zinc-ribbon domain-containing protein [Frigoribacterium sp. 9N]VXC15489.1 conserved hypothetical protein [Frigoribacterium sp. 9N]
MYCPTCASPLPVGAMFCGECGRAVSSADLAAARRRADAAAEHVDATSAPDLPEAPPRATSHPRRSDAQPPWWVRDRQADTGVPEVEVEPTRVDHARSEVPASAPEPPVWPVDDRTVVSTGEDDRPTASEEARAESPRTPDPGNPTVSGIPAVLDGPVGALATPPPETVGSPTPLRVPSEHPDNGPRPSSAPLWTASLTPLPSDDSSPDVVAAVEPPSAEAPHGRRDDDGEVRSGEVETSTAPDGTRPVENDHTEGATDPEATVMPDESAPSSDSASEVAPGDRVAPPAGPPPLVRPTADGPRDGDTAPVAALGRDLRPPVPSGSRPALPESDRPEPVPLVEPAPLVEPVPLVEPGSAVVPERCTHCGAPIDEDDIFCGECGAVVQSVALSFTGPVVPLPPEWRPDDESVLRRRPATQDREGAGSGSDDAGTSSNGPSSGDDVPVRDEADDRQDATPRLAPEPIDHVPGFRAERPAATATPSVAGVPPAPTSSSAPSWRPRRAPVDLPDDADVDETRIVRRGVLGTEYVLQFSTGESITVDGTGLVGRAPTPQPGERFDQLVRIVDPGKSVSKTHLEFGQEAGALWVSDRWSGNGTVVRPRDLPPRRADPGVRVRVTRGTRVEIGEQFFVVV